MRVFEHSGFDVSQPWGKQALRGGKKPGERGAGPLKTKGYRPGRKSARRRQDRRPKHKSGGSRAQP